MAEILNCSNTECLDNNKRNTRPIDCLIVNRALIKSGVIMMPRQRHISTLIIAQQKE